MRGQFYPKELKEKVEKLRSSGVTYGQLTSSFKIPKSTLSSWLGKKYPGVFDKEARLKHLESIRILAQDRARKVRLEKEIVLRDRVAKEFKLYPVTHIGFQKSILASLYWAEGAKHDKVSGVRFANTDPKMIALFMTLLRGCYSPDETRFRVRLHVHYYHKKNEVKNFWAQLLKVPKSQFWKIYEKKRSKTKRFRKNFMGICFIYHPDSNIRKELMEISRNLGELI